MKNQPEATRIVKRYCATVFAVLLLVLINMVPLVAMADEGGELTAGAIDEKSDNIASGSCGTCVWTIDSEGTLLIEPEDGVEGTLDDWGYDAPWSAYCDDIRAVRFSGEIHALTCCEMFSFCSSLASLDLSGLDTSSVTCMGSMFHRCSSLAALDLSGLDTSSVTDMSSMFGECSSLVALDLSGFDTSSVADMNKMFSGCRSLASLDLSSFDTSSVWNMYWMFAVCPSLSSLDLSGFDVSSVVDMGGMFQNCSSLSSLDLSGFDTSSVESMDLMFKACSSLVLLDLSSFNTTSVSNMKGMFKDCELMQTVFVSESWSTNSVIDATSMFDACNSLVGGNGTAYSETQGGIEYAHIDSEGAPGYFTYKQFGPLSRLGFAYSDDSKISFSAHTKGGAASEVTTRWDDSWFAADGAGYIYNHELATAACVLACAAYEKSIIEDDYEILGFDRSYRDGTYMPSSSDYERTVDLVGYSLAIKDIDIDGGTVPLVVVSVRGTPGNDEWLSNLNLSNSSRENPLDHHEGFESCKEEVLYAIRDLIDYYESRGYKFDLDEVRVLVTGHSRGAAVANLVAAALDDGELSDGGSAISAGNVYAYTFAAPATTRARESNDGLYHNINNIVNPEDLVPHVPLGKWGYYRYGRTLMLPSVSNTSPWKYAGLKSRMNSTFVEVSDGSSYKPFRLGAATSAAVADLLGCGVESVKAYYEDTGDNGSFYNNVHTVVLYAMLDKTTKSVFDSALGGLLKTHPVVAASLLCVLWADSSVDAAGFSGASARLSDALSHVSSEGGVKAAAFRAITPIGDEVANGHMPETYVSWMKAIDEGFFVGRTFLGMTVKCPVDVYVYAPDGSLVCKIEDDEVDESLLEEGLPAYVIGDKKHIDIPNDSEYRIEIVAREEGEMDFVVEEYGGDGLELEGSKAYLGVPLVEGQLLTCDSDEGLAAGAHVLMTGSEEAVASEVKTGTGDRVTVTVESEGPGEAWGDREAVAGSSVTVYATAKEGAVFDGWYLNGSKVSEEPEYNFKAEESLSLTAKFRGSLESAAVAEIAEQVYTGKAVEPEVVVVYDGITLEAGVDYTVGYSGNVNATTSAEVKITGMGAYTGILTKAFVIAPAPLDEAVVNVESGGTYTGEANEPAVDVELGGKVLTEDVDYTVAYSNNVNAGKNAAVVVTGIGNYAGEVREAFTIVPATLAVSDLSSVSAAAYTGLEVKPSVTVKHGGKTLVAGVDYKVSYANNVNVGTSAKATVTGIGNYTGAVSRSFSITPAKLFSMALSKATYACDGKQKSPSVTVKGANGATLKEGVDFTLSTPEGRTDPGKYAYKATGKGNYTGSVTAVLEITGTKPAPAPAGKGVARSHRLAGDTALDTMSKIVDAGSFPKGGTVVLATSEGYWDALTAAGVAGLADAPVLMTGGSSLSPETRAQIAKLKPKTIVICGGPAAVSRTVESQAKSAAGGATAIRCQGGTATGTACKIFENGSRFGAWSDTAFVCTNAGYWDALAAAPISYAKHMPIFLTEGASSISDETVAAMKKGGIAKVYVVGGRFAITQAVLDKLGRNGIKVVDRLWGNDAIETSEKVAQFGTGAMGMTADRMGVATNGGYWDALAGAALCGREGSVLVLVDGPSAGSIGGYMAKMKDDIATFYIFGGTAAVSRATENAAVRAAK